jgi:hypothetical protein
MQGLPQKLSKKGQIGAWRVLKRIGGNKPHSLHPSTDTHTLE